MKKRFCLIVLLVLALALLASCTDKNDHLEEDYIQKLGLVNVGRDVTGTAEAKIEIAPDAQTLLVEDFGAVGDGETDDSRAIKNAVDALKSAPAGSKLVFGKDKTYCCRTARVVLNMTDVKDKIVSGDNTTLLATAPYTYLVLEDCERVVLEGFKFNNIEKPYAISTKVENINTEDLTAEITFDRSLGIVRRYGAPCQDYFGVLSREDSRYHMAIAQIEPLDAPNNKYLVRFKDTFADIQGRMKSMETYDFICPMPGAGQTSQPAFQITRNTDVTLRNLDVYSYSYFGFMVRFNEGTVYFENVNMTPDPAETNPSCRIVGWRDGFHCKENRAQLIWRNCDLSSLYDDLFNISASLLEVTDVGEDGTVSFYWPENSGKYGFVKEGDEMSFYNIYSGTLLGRSKVKTVVGEDKVILEEPIKNLEKSVVAVDNTLGAPNSVIVDCKLHGTMRFRNPVYVADSDIWCLGMAIGLESPGTRVGEGPVPENILFTNCRFSFDDMNSAKIYVSAVNSEGDFQLSQGQGSQDDYYHVKNLVFLHCNIDASMISLQDIHGRTDDTLYIID